MRLFKLIPTFKTKKWLSDNKLCMKGMQYALTMLYNDIKPDFHIKNTTIIVQVDYVRDASTYVFGTNKIYLCADPDYQAKSQRQKKFVIFLHFLHEFRHWMQSQILGIKDSQLKYTDLDVEKNSKNYRRDKYEIDARNFEKKYVRRFMRYYVEFISSYQ